MRKGYHWMNRSWKNWGDVSIRLKSTLLMGTVLAVTWTLVVLVLLQLQHFSGESAIIMNKYLDATSFMNTFSTENVCLEAFLRPMHSSDTLNDYLNASAATDAMLERLQPDIQADRREEYVLKRAICNAMEHYRRSQMKLLASARQEDRVTQYLSLKTQAAYIDDYVRSLLDGQMNQGGEQWRAIVAANASTSRRFMVFLFLATLLMGLVLALFHSSILLPLSELGAAADCITTGRYDAPPIPVRSGDEIGRTAQSFNLMQAEIRRTIRELEKKSALEKHLLEKEVETAQMQRKLQEGRFAQLQSQINPHFLFNTLNTIAALAREEQAPLSEDLILRLSSFFRYSLESDEKVVTLGRELKLLRDYMELQETRYGERIAMEIQADETLADVPVPKFILQPLVENAIIHGLSQQGGRLRVRAFRGRRGITVTVTDNGCGFDPRQRKEEGRHRSIGMDNIRERMELSGGRMDVFSRPGLGTCVRLTVKEEDTHDQDPGS